MRYHITAKGNPGQCKAKPGNCPFGADTPHYDSKEAAAEAFERANKEATHQASSRATKTKEPAGFQEVANANVKEAVAKMLASGGHWVEGTEDDHPGAVYLEDSGGTLKLVVIPAYDGHAPEIRHDKDFATDEKAPISPRMLQNASQESGYSARAYLRLLNHQNYDQAKDLYGKVKDADVIEAVKESHRASEALVTLQDQLTKAQERLSYASTPEQRKGYLHAADEAARKLTEAGVAHDTAQVEIKRLQAKYAKQLGIHNNSLKALERLAFNSDKKFTRPEGIERRIKELTQVKNSIKPIAPIVEKLGRGNLDKTAEAAKAYGNPYYAEAAEKLRAASVERDVLSESLRGLRATAQHPNKAVRDAALSELDKGNFSLVGLNSIIRANEPRTELFRNEIRDRARNEDEIARELSALNTIEVRTRNQ